MKILNINRFYYRRGGADTYFFTIADILQNKGHTVIPFSTILDNNLSSPYSQYFVSGYTEDTFAKFSILKKSKIFFNDIYSLEAKRKLKQLIRQEKPDIAHIHTIFYQLSLSVLDVLKENKIPSTITLHDYFILCANGYLYRNGHICELCKNNQHKMILLHRCYKDAFFPSLMAYLVKKMQYKLRNFDFIKKFWVYHEDMKNLMIEWGIDKNKIGVIHMPFNSKQYNPNYTFGDYIVSYGRFTRLKGFFTILKAMKLLKDIKLKIFGFGPDKKDMQNYIIENKLDNVEICPWLPWGEELIKVISKAKFVVFAPEWFAPGDFVILESFSLGKPVVTSAIAGSKFLVKDNYNGLLFKPGDEKSLAEKIKELYSNHSRIIEMGKNARQFVETEMNFEKFYEKLMSVYMDIITNKQRS